MIQNKSYSFFLLLFVILLFFVFEFSSAQVILTEEEVRIGQINVQGNVKTKQDIIIRELEFKTGDLVSQEMLELARKRIENLNIFNRVMFNFKDADDQKDLVILVWERWYILPTPIFDINEHDWSKLSYGFGIFHSNFRGRAENVWFAGWLGYNPGLNLSYSNRWFGGKHRLYTSVNLKSQRIENKTLLFPDLNQHHRSVSLLFGRRYGIHWYSDVELKMNFIEADEDMKWQNKDNRDRVFSSIFKIQRDTRDLWEYPRKGSRMIFSFSRSMLLNGSDGFNKWSFDWREFRTLFGITIAGRIFGETTQQTVPIYKHIYLGYGERIRGYFDNVYEGENRILSSLEFRLPIFRQRYYQVPSDTWMATYFQQLKFGMYFTIFRDAGAVWYQDEKLHPRHWRAGTGVGLNFILPYSNIFRIEYAFDEEGNAQTIFDVNVAF